MTPTPKGETVDSLRERAERFLDEVGDGDLAEDMAIFARAVVRDREQELHDRVLLTEHERDSETTRAEAAEEKLRERDAEIARLKGEVEAKVNEARLEMLGQVLHALGLFEGARPDSPVKVWSEVLTQLARHRRQVEAAEFALREIKDLAWRHNDPAVAANAAMALAKSALSAMDAAPRREE